MKNAKLVLGALFSLSMAVDEAEQNDGKIDMKDLPLLAGPALLFPGAIAAAKPAMEEFKNASKEERGELTLWIEKEYDIADDKLEKKIETVLAALVILAELAA